MPKMKYVHVALRVLMRNRRRKSDDPPLIVRTGRTGKGAYGHRIAILDADGNIAATLVYTPKSPLKSGAVVYIECPNGARVD